MRARRRSVASLFAALFVWLTAVSSARVAQPREIRLISAEADGIAAVTIAAPRAPTIVARVESHSTTAPHDQPVLLASAVALPAEDSPAARHAPAAHARARSAQGIASTYDATAPPRTR